MKKNFFTTMPDKMGAFLKASKCFAQLGINITRTSYNKAVDVHSLFIEAEGDEKSLSLAEERLKEFGFLNDESFVPNLTIMEFKLPDRPGEVIKILELICLFGFNISYISSRENGGEYQKFRIGFIAEKEEELRNFKEKAQEICPVKLIDYDKTELTYDNTIFYKSFADGLANLAGLGKDARRKLAINTNMAMQTLDERGEPAFTTFDCIRRFCEHIFRFKGVEFNPRITWHTLTDKTDLIIIEPPCGSNTMVFRSGGKYLYIDTGYACYKEEMEKILKRLFPDFDVAPRDVLLTHADVDHCGLLNIFDKIYLSRKSYGSLKAEYENGYGLREKHQVHRPYVRICKLLTGYEPPNPQKMEIISDRPETESAPLVKTGEFTFEDMHFTVFEGAGGHLPGELVIADAEHKICFTGDVFINLSDMTTPQKKYNSYAPILMTTVDSDPGLAAKERKLIKKEFSGFKVFGSHGGVCDM